MAPLPPQDLDHILTHTQVLWEDLREQSLFLTGGTGFVGTWLLESLLMANDKLHLDAKVTVLTRHPEQFRANSPHLALHPSVQLLDHRLAAFEFPNGDFPFVLHAATEAPFEPDPERPLGVFAADVDGTRRLLDFARLHGVRRFLFTSSGAVYGKQPSQLTHIPEEYLGAPSTTDTLSAYGQAKRASEFMSIMYGHACGFDATIARLFTFVGPLLPLDANYAVGNFIGNALHGQTIRVTGNGRPRRSYLYAADLAIWLWTIFLRGKAGVIYNVGSQTEISIAQLAQLIALDGKIEVADAGDSETPAPRYVPSTLRAETDLGLRCLIPLDEGLRRTIAWHREQI